MPGPMEDKADNLNFAAACASLVCGTVMQPTARKGLRIKAAGGQQAVAVQDLPLEMVKGMVSMTPAERAEADSLRPMSFSGQDGGAAPGVQARDSRLDGWHASFHRGGGGVVPLHPAGALGAGHSHITTDRAQGRWGRPSGVKFYVVPGLAAAGNVGINHGGAKHLVDAGGAAVTDAQCGTAQELRGTKSLMHGIVFEHNCAASGNPDCAVGATMQGAAANHATLTAALTVPGPGGGAPRTIASQSIDAATAAYVGGPVAAAVALGQLRSRAPAGTANRQRAKYTM